MLKIIRCVIAAAILRETVRVFEPSRCHSLRRRPFFAVVTLLFVAANIRLLDTASAQPAVVPEIRPGILKGYLSSEALPDSLSLLPAPPAPDTAALALDQQISRKDLNLRGTPRWALATEDADLRFPQAAGTFSCALGAPITEQDTPHLYMLMRRSLSDAGLATYPAKNHYERPRPFAMNGKPICTPGEETHLLEDGSYPSGHTSIGWAWAPILAEIAPDQTDALLARGRAFGQSRVVCNVHWQSDVIEGRFIGAAVVARLHADGTFLADLQAGKLELASARAHGLKPSRDCAEEASEMALDPPSAP
jgi:acid phosphatase (class A)